MIIYVRDMIIGANHGIDERERAAMRPFRLSVELTTTGLSDTRTDRLDDTVDVAAVRQSVYQTVTQNSFALIERLADEVARNLLDLDDKIEEVLVSVEKINPLKLGTSGVLHRVSRKAIGSHQISRDD